MAQGAAEPAAADEPPALAPGARVLVASAQGLDAATVRYVGPVAGTEGLWAGVQFDAAGRGKHDGSHAGVAYFAAPPSSAAFVRLHKLRTGCSLLQALRVKYEEARLPARPPRALPLSARPRRATRRRRRRAARR